LGKIDTIQIFQKIHKKKKNYCKRFWQAGYYRSSAFRRSTRKGARDHRLAKRQRRNVEGTHAGGDGRSRPGSSQREFRRRRFEIEWISH
jgi:hypothetical protein